MSLIKICSEMLELCESLDTQGQFVISDSITETVNRIAANQTNIMGLPIIDSSNPYGASKQQTPPQQNNVDPYAQQTDPFKQLTPPKKPENKTYNPQRLPKTAQPYIQSFVDASNATGYPVKLLLSLAFAESSFNPKAKSGVGAYGLMQLYPATPEQQQEPSHNILGGAQKLRNYHDMFGNIESGLAAYNWGPYNLKKAGGDYRKAPGSVQKFVQNVIQGQKNYA